MNILLVTGILAAAGILTALASLVYLHVVPTGLAPLHNAVSEYGISAHRGGYRLATIGLGVAGLALATALGSAVPGSLPAVILLVAFGVARLLISWWPMDAPGAPKTAHGRGHNLLAIAAFATATAAGFLAAAPLSAQPGWNAFAPAATVFTWVMAVGSAGVILSPAVPVARRYFGALERIIYVGIIGWFTVLAIATLIIGVWPPAA